MHTAIEHTLWTIPAEWTYCGGRGRRGGGGGGGERGVGREVAEERGMVWREGERGSERGGRGGE